MTSFHGRSGIKVFLIGLVAATFFSAVVGVIDLMVGFSTNDPPLWHAMLTYYVSAIGISTIVVVLAPFRDRAGGRAASTLLGAAFGSLCVTTTLHGIPSRWDAKAWFVAGGIWAMLTVVAIGFQASQADGATDSDGS